MKLKSFYSYVALFIISLFVLTGCGGNGSSGGESNGTAPNASPTPTVTPLPSASPTPTITKTKGYLIDSPLQGVTYVCDGKEALTDASGLFECANPPVSFKIGGLTLGTLTAFTADNKVYPQDLLGLARTNFTDSRLKLLARLLQSLDDDGDIATKITITESVRNGINAVQDFKALRESQITSLLSKVGKSFVQECGALNHLGDTSLSCNNDGSYYVYTPAPTANQKITVNGKVADGYLDNAKVCLDKNENGKCDTGEPNTLSVNGSYDLSIDTTDVGKYPILVEVTTSTVDLDDNQTVANEYTLTAPKD